MEGRYDEARKQFEAANPNPDDAAAQRALAVALLRSKRGSHRANHERAVETLRGLIALLDNTSTDAARAQAILGYAMLNAQVGKREDNIADAIAHLEKAVEVLDKRDHGPWWAETMHHLGVALLETRGAESYASNVRRAIECFEQAMTVWSRSTDPGHWAAIQASLGAAWERLPEGDKRENLKHAVGCFELSCSVRTRDSVPVAWARLQNALGTAWLQLALLGGEQEWVTQSVEASIAAHSGALEIWAREGRKHEWAHTQHALASAWMAMPTGNSDERRAILERVVEGYRLALEVRSKSKSPTEWAATQHSLAHALVQLGGDRDVMLLREAIVCYENALSVRNKKRNVIDWARSEAGLAHAMTLIKVGDRNRHLSDAINRLKAVLVELKAERFARVRRPFELWLEDAKAKLDESCGDVKLADGA
jgi:tetratricopeptide (TPR) repeat protein